jgi:hypothetical protein
MFLFRLQSCARYVLLLELNMKRATNPSHV